MRGIHLAMSWQTQTLIWQVSLLHCEYEALDYNTHTPSFQTRTSSIYEYKTIQIQNRYKYKL